ncbi:hypothetical protein QAD02_009370 [Eretmocerus hayati]|uniref:Uncharacterized protein n=1 Tax=Eretmocerus hayati TaxID=131215 RepID=A0ACC2NBH9_9HYME|nr:hypothetical protein QAD02_009370 [Eretmocerus hayati]
MRRSDMLCAKILLAVAICATGSLAAPQRLQIGAGGGGGSDADKNAVITSQQLEVGFDGNYVNNFETSNGISHQESGAPKQAGPEGPSISSQGATSYTAPNGEVVSIQFQADENGYVAQGSHIPTAPPIPPEILRALEWNAAHPEEDSIDSGAAPNRPPPRG